MTIIATIPHMGESLTVEVIDVFRTGDGRKLVIVRSMAGQPFTNCTHGGPAESDSANVPACALSDVQVIGDPGS